MAKRTRKAILEVPKAVFERFLDELRKDPTMIDVAARLKPVLLDEDVVSEAAIKAALLPDEAESTSV